MINQVAFNKRGSLSYIFFLSAVMTSSSLLAQNEILKLDDTGKCAYGEVIELKSANNIELFKKFKVEVIPLLKDASQLIYLSNKNLVLYLKIQTQAQ